MTEDIRSFENLEHAVQLANTRFGSDVYWRGHGNAAWNLRPHVFRDPRYHEISLLIRFTLGAPARMPNPPPSADLFAWLQYAQHYGLPTRLLDWSASPLIALYFAVCNVEHDDEDGCIWALNPSGLNKQHRNQYTLLMPSHPDVMVLVQQAFGQVAPYDGAASRRALAVTGHLIDLRMLVQQAQFTIHSEGTDLRDLPSVDWLLYQWHIPKGSKGFLRSWLRRWGVTKGTVYPDLGAFAEELGQLPSP
ncbi:MAG TPA: FRG domain-containing protein [Candidatus Sulfotelmatobacter sp.]|nr:FRG domain-containing protein [Candidatus Sulfotelmatobacter sp.]